MRLFRRSITPCRRSRFSLKSQSGHILVWVLGLLLVAAILSAAVISFAYSASQSTKVSHSRRQAQFTAKSAVSAMAQHIIENNLGHTQIEAIIDQTGTGSIPGMGDYKVTLEYVGTNQLKISAVGEYGGQSARESVILNWETPLPGIHPMDNIFYFTNPGEVTIGQIRLDGDVFAEGSLRVQSSAHFKGKVRVMEDLFVNSACHFYQDVTVNGNVNIASSPQFYGQLNLIKNLTVTGWASFQKDVILNGNLNSTGFQLLANIYVSGIATLTGGDIQGTLYYGLGKSMPQWLENSIQPQRLEIMPSLEPMSFATGLQPILPPSGITRVITFSDGEDMSKRTISENGIITQASVDAFRALGPYSPHNDILIDATKQDIHIVLQDGVHWDFGGNKHVKIRSNGKYNVYLYMMGDSSIILRGGNDHIKMETPGETPRLFIFGNGTGQKLIKLTSNGELDAHIYIPRGATLETSGSSNKFRGSCTVPLVNLGSNSELIYAAPDLKGTPVENIPGGSNSGGSGWTMGKWSAK